MSGFSEMLAYLRKREGLSQQELADKLGVTRSRIGMYETAKREPDFESLEAIADFFNVDMDYLLGKSDVPNKFTFYTDAIDICKETFGLSLSPEQAHELISKAVRPQHSLPYNAIDGADILSYLTKDEELLIYCYRLFTDEGQHKIESYISDLGQNPNNIKAEYREKNDSPSPLNNPPFC